MNTFLERIHTLDTKVFIWINLKQSCHYHRLIRNISRTGDGPTYLIIGLIILIFEHQSGLYFFLTSVAAFVLNISLYLIIKNTIKRDRPQQKLRDFQSLIEPSDKFSFPSGHTAAAFVFAIMISQFYPVMTAFVFLWALLIGVSRVLLGVHYPGDIIAGAALGSTCAIIALSAPFN